MEIDLIVKEIELVVAPAVMTSSAALLLLGFQTKFSNLANRFRALNHERRELTKKKGLSETDQARVESLATQAGHLLQRATHVKNAILMTYGAIVLFLLTSVLLFFSQRGASAISPWLLAVFMTGLLLELGAAGVMMRETALAFKVIHLESRSS